MSRIRSYTSIWNVEKVIYAISDWKLPFPVTINQMAWALGTLFSVIFFQHVPPLSFIENPFIKYGVLPVSITWFMSQKTFDGKKPYRFIASVIGYIFRPKVTFSGKIVKLCNTNFNQAITAVRSEVYVPDKISS
jgi:hypothetical protein